MKLLFALLTAACLSAQAAETQNAPAVPSASSALKQRPALQRSDAAREMMLGIAKAGRRLVAVGDHGVVLLSDDNGKSFRQAKMVPTRATLTGVSFVDDRQGWAAGHWGVILHTEDGGETWSLQRSDVTTDRPLFSVYFSDARRGIAVGLWSLVLVTSDGGAHWNPVTLPAPPEGGKADRNLLAVFSNGKDDWYIAAERGMVLRSADFGATWSYLDTGYKGSFWTGMAAADGTLLVAGLRGTVYRSDDNGQSWSASPTGSKSSITSIVAMPDRIVAVGLDGTILESRDQGRTFTARQREDRASLTGIAVAEDGEVLLLSDRGPVASGISKN